MKKYDVIVQGKVDELAKRIASMEQMGDASGPTHVVKLTDVSNTTWCGASHEQLWATTDRR